MSELYNNRSVKAPKNIIIFKGEITMTKTIRKVVSIICVVAILMSLCVVSMVNQGSAFLATDPSVGGTFKLDFEDREL